jgi:hypothetical protein
MPGPTALIASETKAPNGSTTAPSCIGVPTWADAGEACGPVGAGAAGIANVILTCNGGSGVCLDGDPIYPSATGVAIDLTGLTSKADDSSGKTGTLVTSGTTLAQFTCTNVCSPAGGKWTASWKKAAAPPLPSCKMTAADQKLLTTCAPRPVEGEWYHDKNLGPWVNASGGAGECTDAIGCTTIDGKVVTSGFGPNLGICLAVC